jgi:hypothetical protein
VRTRGFVFGALMVTAAAILALVGCQATLQEPLVKVNFALTDAPVDDELVTAVRITVSGVRVNESADADEGTWTDIVVDPPVPVDLLTLQDGVTLAIGSVWLPVGTQINQIRLTVDGAEIDYDAATYQAKLSTADTTGLKIVRAFDVPLTGETTIAVDFDARKSIVMTGPPLAPTFKLKPVLRAVVEGEAGSISGTGPADHVAYAYRDGTWADSEAIPDAEGLTFTQAYTSAGLGDPDTDGVWTYRLSFLEPGVYDLVLVEDAGGTVVTIASDATVTERHTTEVNF